MSDLIRIPLRFYTDHAERGLPTPASARVSKYNVWVESTDPALPRLLESAREYVRQHESDRRHSQHGLFESAKRTVAAIEPILVTAAAIAKAQKKSKE